MVERSSLHTSLSSGKETPMRTTIILAALSIAAFLPASANAAIKLEPIEYTHGDTTLKGYLAYDDAQTDKRPGILVVHEWWGCNDYAQSRAKQLAELGYVAFACDMYGHGQTTTDPQRAGQLAGDVRKDPRLWLDRAAAGLKVLTDHKLVDANKLAAIGYCFGGTTALQMACDGQNLKAAVSFHGSLFTPAAADAKSIKGTVLVCNGAADTFISADDRKGFVDALEAAKVDYIFVDYAGAVHSFTNPNADKAGIKGVAYDEKADKRSWADMKQVFDEAFGPVVAPGRQSRLSGAPSPLTDDQILRMDRAAATKEWVIRKTYPQKNLDLDDETKARLDDDVRRLRKQMDNTTAR
jgi:dienelactone hydrolase